MNKRRFLSLIILVAFATASFMGIENYEPEERSVSIVETASTAIGNSGAATTEEDSNEDTSSDKADESENMDTETQGTAGISVDAKSAVLLDCNSKEILYELNADEKLPPASVTKVMTLLLIMEACESGKISLKDQVTISENAASMGGSQMYMEAGETHTAEDLVKGIIMVSANDGCVAMAEHLSGSVESFVKAMNARAKELGLENTNFVNTNGLPESDHYSSTYDIGLISIELIKYNEILPYFTTWQDTITVGKSGHEKELTLTNTNKLINKYNGLIGIKTGFTADAGYCLSTAAERDNTRLVAVVFGCETSETRFNEGAKLLDYGFANYETVIVVKKGDKVGTIESIQAKSGKITAVAKSDIKVTVPKGEAEKVAKEVTLYEDIKVPAKAGKKIGEIKAVYTGKEVGSAAAVTKSKVEKAGLFTIIKRRIAGIFSGLRK